MGEQTTAVNDVGSAANPIRTSVNSLIANTVNSADLFIVEVDGLSALSVSGGFDSFQLTVAAGAVSDSDISADIVADTVNIVLSDPSKQNFGSSNNPIQTRVEELAVNTAAGAAISSCERAMVYSR